LSDLFMFTIEGGESSLAGAPRLLDWTIGRRCAPCRAWPT
jgi:hypothetical protein